MTIENLNNMIEVLIATNPDATIKDYGWLINKGRGPVVPDPPFRAKVVELPRGLRTVKTINSR